MSTVHKNLTGSDLHEPKGADTATSGKVYVSDGVGSGVWTDASTIITNTAFSTGDLKPTHKVTADSTWIMWSDGTIGDGSSTGSIRANADTAALFALYWNNYSNALCAVSGGRGVSAVADYAAHKTIALPLAAGRAFGLAGAGSGLTSRAVGATAGGETTILVTANLPPYTPVSSGTQTVTGTSVGSNIITGAILGGNNTNQNISGGGGSFFPMLATGNGQAGQISITGTATITMAAQGGTSTPLSIVQPTSFINVMVKL